MGISHRWLVENASILLLAGPIGYSDQHEGGDSGVSTTRVGGILAASVHHFEKVWRKRVKHKNVKKCMYGL